MSTNQAPGARRLHPVHFAAAAAPGGFPFGHDAGHLPEGLRA